jgi:hypothetical protein
VSNKQYYAKLGPDARRVDDTVQRAIGDATFHIVDEMQIPFTVETTDAFINACLSNGAALAIRRNLDEGAYMRVARQAWARAMAATKAVDAEDDN